MVTLMLLLCELLLLLAYGCGLWRSHGRSQIPGEDCFRRFLKVYHMVGQGPDRLGAECSIVTGMGQKDG